MRYWLTVLFLAPLFSFGQCLAGAIGVSGPGCGCASGCDLTPYGGPLCVPIVTGNCLAGNQYMSVIVDLDISCEARVTAVMEPRPGCSASGADGTSATTGDRLRVRNALGPLPAWQIGGDNASIFDEHTQLGGQILVEGFANRADEIITWEAYQESGDCPFCILLPVEWAQYNVFVDGFTVDVHWATYSESNNRGFFIQASQDLKHWLPFGFAEGRGSSLQYSNYTHRFELPNDGAWYVRILQEDFNGARSASPIVHIAINASAAIELIPSASGAQLSNHSADDMMGSLRVFRPDGRMIELNEICLKSSESRQIDLPNGLSLIQFTLRSGRRYTFKIMR
jgi:hypothetical protein